MFATLNLGLALLGQNQPGRPVHHPQSHRSLLMTGQNQPLRDWFPDLFPELMAAAINRQDITQWAAAREIVTARGDK